MPGAMKCRLANVRPASAAFFVARDMIFSGTSFRTPIFFKKGDSFLSLSKNA